MKWRDSFGSDGEVVTCYLGLSLQDFQLFPHLTVLDNPNTSLRQLRRWECLKEDAEKKSSSPTLTRFRSGEPQEMRYPYSGDKTTCCICALWWSIRKFAGYDNSTSALNSGVAPIEVENSILQNRETGITQIEVITHDMQFAQHIADEIVTINPK